MIKTAPVSKTKPKSKLKYYVALCAVVLIWGIDPVVAVSLYDYYSPSSIAAVCALISALFFLAISGDKIKNISKTYFKRAIPISLVTSAACMLQKIGLRFTTPSSYAFLEHISCLVVPPLLFLLIKKKPKPLEILSGVVCLVGCFIFCGVAEGGLALGLGEIMCFSAGILLGVSIALMGAYTGDLDIRLYMVIHLFVYSIFSALCAVVLNFVRIDGVPFETFLFSFDPKLLLAFFAYGFTVIGIGWFLRTEAIARTDPTFVAVVSPMAAVVTAVISIAIGIDKLTVSLAVGAVIILAATIMSGLASREK